MVGGPTPEDVRREQILRAAFEVGAKGGLGGLTVRAVAAEAEVSHALGGRILPEWPDALPGIGGRHTPERVDALLRNQWTPSPGISGRIAPEYARTLDTAVAVPHSVTARERLHRLIQREIDRVIREPGPIRLFFEYRALGARHPAVEARIGKDLERYRAAFRVVVEELLVAEPATFPGATPDGMAAVAVSWVRGALCRR